MHSIWINLGDDWILALVHVFVPHRDAYLRSHRSNTRTESTTDAKEHEFSSSLWTWCEIFDCGMTRDLLHRSNQQLAPRRNLVPGRYAARMRQWNQIKIHFSTANKK